MATSYTLGQTGFTKHNFPLGRWKWKNKLIEQNDIIVKFIENFIKFYLFKKEKIVYNKIIMSTKK
jgi:hypothetical protein